MIISDLASFPTAGNYAMFLSGPPGAGKTSIGVQRLFHLRTQDIPAEQILVLVPQRTLATPYHKALNDPQFPSGAAIDIATIGGLARRTLDLFWPAVAEEAGFSQPQRLPRFLTLETTQYHMDRVLDPFLAEGWFSSIVIPRSRLASQIIDNLNKAAAIGFPPEEIAGRLQNAWGGQAARLAVYEQVQEVALAFRKLCLQESLLDWSLQIEVFWHHLLPLPLLRRYLLSGYRHIIADNLEEDIPVTHDLLRRWLPLCESALLIQDMDGGYRVFLGADPEGALRLGELCREKAVVWESWVASPEVLALSESLVAPFGASAPVQPFAGKSALVLPKSLRFHPEALRWAAEEIARLVIEEDVPPGEIAVVAPFLNDVVRFSFTEMMNRYGIRVRTHRPSRELREEPVTGALLTWSKLSHPSWHRPPPVVDVAHAFQISIADMDPVRARLLAEIVYRTGDGKPVLLPFHEVVPSTQERISYLLGGRYDEVQSWIEGYVNERGSDVQVATPDKLEHFLARLFELLAQPGFGFHTNLDAGTVTSQLLESIQKFGHSAGLDEDQDTGLAYVDLVERGVLAAQHAGSWQIHSSDALLLMPAYTFLMMNQPVRFQFWLDAGSPSWMERIYQPLTHPYVLRRDWSPTAVWTDEDEVRVREEALTRLLLGLCRRCRDRVYLAHSELSEQGYEQHGPVLLSVHRLLRRQAGANDG